MRLCYVDSYSIKLLVIAIGEPGICRRHMSKTRKGNFGGRKGFKVQKGRTHGALVSVSDEVALPSPPRRDLVIMWET